MDMREAIYNRLRRSHLLSDLSIKQVQDLTSTILDELNCIDLERKNIAQIHRIEYEKWMEGERTQQDPGMDFITNWIMQNGSEFHRNFSKSDCRTCANCFECGGSAKTHCDRYEPDLLEQSRHVLQKILEKFKENEAEEIKRHYKIH